MARLFVALDIPDELRKKVSDIQKHIGQEHAQIRFVEQESLHYTVKFFGEVVKEKVEEVKNVLASIAGSFDKFTAEVCNIGYFGSGKQIRILWTGMGKGREEFIKIAEVVDKKLGYLRTDDHGTSPHLTVGRVGFVKDVEKFQEQIKKFTNINLGSFLVEEIKLKQSVLTKNGPVYKDVAVCRLR